MIHHDLWACCGSMPLHLLGTKPDVHAAASCTQVIGDWVAERTMEEVLAAMKEARVPSGPILSSQDIYHEAQFRERGMFHRARPPDGALAAHAPVVQEKAGAETGQCMRARREHRRSLQAMACAQLCST